MNIATVEPWLEAPLKRYVDDARTYLDERAGEPRVLIRIRPEKLVSWKLR